MKTINIDKPFKSIKYLFIILIISNFFICPYEKYVDFDLIQKADAPRFIENGVLFTLSGDDQNQIYLRTNIDNWHIDYKFKTSLYNILYLFLPFNPEIKVIKYKININGYWITDPNNADYILDEFGTKISMLQIPDETPYYESMPIIKDSDGIIKEVKFKYFDNKASEVNFVCSIDNWSEYSHPMQKNENGSWETTKYFTKGTYMYYFLVNGKKVIDINNEKKLWDKRRGQVSFFTIK